VLLPGVILQVRVRGEHAEIGPDPGWSTPPSRRAIVTSSVCRRSTIGPDARVGTVRRPGEGTEVRAGAVVAPVPSDPDAASR